MCLRSLLAAALLLAGAGAAGATEPAKVIVGTYINKILDLSFTERHYTLDFYVWFRWKPEGELREYKPLETFELMNGRIMGKQTSIVEKKLGDENYASARVTATIWENWKFTAFPFDKQPLSIHLEDSKRVASEMVFVPDRANSRLGDEIDVSGWKVSNFESQVTNRLYETNYGDTSLPTGRQSEYSRVTFSMDLGRDNYGAAMKVLATMIVATLVAFVAFVIKPTDVDPRFGVGVGALFAVAASAFIVASAVPDSSALTAADKMHMVSMAFIFGSLVESAICLKWDETGQKGRSKRLDRWCVFIFPLLFALSCGWVVLRALR